MGIYTKTRNGITGFFYKKITKPILFKKEPEEVHDTATKLGKIFGSNKLLKLLLKIGYDYQNKMLEQEIHGIKFKNPIGLSAGFDKNAELTDVMPAIGFGYQEIGSITGEPCEGNPKPRLWRLPKSKSLLVYYGLKNNGCEEIAKRLEKKKFEIPTGISIAKTNSKETVEDEKGIKDYVKAHERTKDIGSYTTINISCPNTFGGQPFNDKERLEKLLKELTKIKTKKPLFIKVSPDLTKKQIGDLIELSKKYEIKGLICTNLTKKRDNKKIIETNVSEKGGFSGKIVDELADDLIEYLYKKTKGKITIIGCGGVFTAEDAYKKIKKGASLIQLITGMIYEGPQAISSINNGLVELLKKDGYKNIKEAIGKDLTK